MRIWRMSTMTLKSKMNSLEYVINDGFLGWLILKSLITAVSNKRKFAESVFTFLQ